MKVLHIITSLRTGGAERVVRDITPILAGEGYEVEILLLDGTRTPLLDQVEAQGIKVTALSKGWKAMSNPFLMPKLAAFVKKGGFDIVHSHNTACQLMAAAVPLAAGTKLITTEHNTTNRRRNLKWFKPIDRWMYGRYRKIICVSEDVRKSLVAYLPCVDGKSVVISNGIDISRIQGATPAADIASSPGRKVLMVAAFRAQKDHATMITTLDRLPDDYHLYLAGGAETYGDAMVLAECRNLVSQKGLEGRVSFLGIRPDIPSVMAASDVIVLASHYEGKPIVALEGMVSGKPFIASDVDGLRSLLHGTGLLFPDGDADALAALIRRVTEDKEAAHAASEKCLELVKGMDVSATVAAYSKVYNEIQ